MGHCFTRSHWKWKNSATKQWTELLETPCFAAVNNLYIAADAVRTTLKPTIDRMGPLKEDPNELIARCGDPSCKMCVKVPRKEIARNGYPGGVPIEKMKEFVADIATACPGVFTQVDEWEFEYPLGSIPNYLKFLGVASLVRCVEEWWLYVEEYFELRKRGIPVDVALLCMNLGSRDPRPSCGHSFSMHLGGLISLKNFTLKDAYLSKCEAVTTRLHPIFNDAYPMWGLLHDKPWFTPGSTQLPLYFTLTREIYEMLCADKVNLDKIAEYIAYTQNKRGSGYNAVAA